MSQEFHQGTDVKLDTLVYTDDSFSKLFDVTGATITGRLGNKARSVTYLSATGAVIGDGLDGLVRVTLTDVETQALPAHDLDYICEVIDTGGNKGVVVDQVVRVLPSLQ